MTYRKKLIEVSLPLEAINAESAREKSIRHGHPSTLHLWWARRPLAACRAVLWSSLVDDPSEYMPDEASANEERERLFAILEQLVKWENINNEDVLDKARLEIARSVARDLGVDAPVGKAAIRKFLAEQAPPVLDPFAGGGSIPLEAQRLGLRAYASDLNPVAVLINKALIEIPPKFAGMPPVHPPEENNGTTKSARGKRMEKAAQEGLWAREWKGAEGLAEDVRYYGKWMRDEAEKRIGHLYPKVKITAEMLAEREDLRKQGLKAGDELTVIAWLWARTVKCPNPACGIDMPLVNSFWLSQKEGQKYWVQPSVTNNQVTFDVRYGKGQPTDASKVGRGSTFRCIACEGIISEHQVRKVAKQGKMGAQLMSVVALSDSGRCYFSPEAFHSSSVNDISPQWIPDFPLQGKAAMSLPLYGMSTYGDIFTSRQLSLLNTLVEILGQIHNNLAVIVLDKLDNFNDDKKLAVEYANAVVTYLAFSIDKVAEGSTGLCTWSPLPSKLHVVSTFGRQALPMVWDFAEANPFADSSGNISRMASLIADVIERATNSSVFPGNVKMVDARKLTFMTPSLVSTDPPYYDNICYADLSDFAYIWLRQSISEYYPDLFKTVLVPKNDELIASPFRFNSRTEASEYFENGLIEVFKRIREGVSQSFPISVYYAYKQTENDQNEKSNSQITSTGWETMLTSLVQSGFIITGTWPMRTEREGGFRNKDQNSLASSIILLCRPRPEDATTATRREFLAALKRELPPALRQLQLGNIAPVDLAQAAIGPGMAIFSRYKSVLESDGSPMRVRAALALINQALDEYLAEQEGEYDADTRWALAWYEQYGHEAGPYGVAETLSKAKNTSVEGLARSGFLEARAGKVRLLRRDELAEDWDPAKDKRLTAWESAQYLIRALDKDGEAGAGVLLEKLGAMGETVRDLAYRLYTVCERKGWAQEALAYNMLVVAWPRIKEQAGKRPRQESLL